MSDGWLYFYDMGEFGGGIRWFSPKGDRHAVVDDANTRLVAKTRRGVFAVQSLEHLAFSFSRLIRLDRARGRWVTHHVSDLHLVPNAVAQDRDRFVYVTDEFVSTLETDGSQRKLYRNPFRVKLTSIAAMPSGDLWVGAGGALLHLTPAPGGSLTEAWFVPKTGSISGPGQ